MFETYTEKARRVIFFSAYNARQNGRGTSSYDSPDIILEDFVEGLIKEYHVIKRDSHLTETLRYIGRRYNIPMYLFYRRVERVRKYHRDKHTTVDHIAEAILTIPLTAFRQKTTAFRQKTHF